MPLTSFVKIAAMPLALALLLLPASRRMAAQDDIAGDGAQRKDVPIIGDATMTEDRTIIVRMRRTADGKNASGTVRYPVGNPHYQEILNHLGGINPGETKLVPAWDEKK
jgi:hypothetical protein